VPVTCPMPAGETSPAWPPPVPGADGPARRPLPCPVRTSRGGRSTPLGNWRVPSAP
jgi:hypothetical protein